ncbi:hypothetical protein BSKO_10737 [Bryopsis sp. KO-2023]|nr:hypothetical protein BSKO_10737 [Bryopsis sp. KO-2023]
MGLRGFVCTVAALSIFATFADSQTCSETELTVKAIEDCVNAVRKDPEAFLDKYPCPLWELESVNTLGRDSRLKDAAQLHAEDMSYNNFFSHTSSNGKAFNDRIWDAGYPGDTVGENLAVGFNNAMAVVGGWMCSETHRANLLTCAFDEVGTYIDCSADKCYVAQEYGCHRRCCKILGNTGAGLRLGDGFFSRLLARPGRDGNENGKSSTDDCNGIVGCLFSNRFGG